jgi:propionyl-CoA carboxylase alpha chain
VTECTTGLDLVALQLQVAAGERLGERPPPACGHAIEARLYAEDPAEAWQPQTGTLQLLEVPGVTDRFGCAEAGSGLRLDSGVRSGDRVEPFYDAMLAKLIGYGPDRTQAARRLSGALRRATIHGLRTNRDQLVRVLEDPDFLAGHTSTALLERAELSAPLAGAAAEELAAVAAALADAAFEHAQSPVQAGLPAGWRNVYSEPHQRSYRGRFGEQRVLYRYGRSAIELAGHPGLQVVSVAADEVRLETAGVRRSFRLSRYPDCVEVDSALGAVALRPVDRFTDPDAAPDAGSLLAPLPGAVLRLAVTVGQRVARGEPLLWIEAMKMEHPVRAARDGQVSEIAVAAGDQVAVGDRLVVLDPVDQLP